MALMTSVEDIYLVEVNVCQVLRILNWDGREGAPPVEALMTPYRACTLILLS